MINHQGVVNNVIEVILAEATVSFASVQGAFQVKASKPMQGPKPSPLDIVMGDPGSYGQEIPRDFSADPPPLPPQLGMLPHLNPAQSSLTSGSKPSDPNSSDGNAGKDGFFIISIFVFLSC